jgi:hypothetical protein
MFCGLRGLVGGDEVGVLGVGLVIGVLVVVLGAVEGVGFDGVRVFDGGGFDGATGLVSGSSCAGTRRGTGSGGFPGALTLGSEEPFAVEAAVTAAEGSDVAGAGSG